MEISAVQEQTLILFSIGPVQEFIAQARKTRDLWFGSHLLSELSKAAAVQLLNSGGELIFPYIDGDMIKDEPSLNRLKVANKILAIIRTDDPKQVAWEVRHAVTGKWMKYADDAEKLLRQTNCINPAMWKRQVKDVIEFHAAWSLYKDKDSYRAVLERTEQLLAARKTLRDFKQNEPGELFGEKKSSLDSGRESVLLPSRAASYMRYGIKAEETLDAISLVKRLSTFVTLQGGKFPSVCESAFLPFREMLYESATVRKRVSDYYNKLKEQYAGQLEFKGVGIETYDSRLFYANRIEDYVDELAVGGSAEEKKNMVECISMQLQQLYETIRLNPSSYYAFMLCDGDRMGDQLRKITTHEEHQMFSQHLSRFSTKAEQVIREHKGELIYSGGDDVMAYIPLHRCLDVSKRLHEEFAEIMKGTVSPGQERPTLSVGISIVHMREPLEEVRKLAMKAEGMAKIHRNELAIIYQKRSGGDLMNISLSFDLDPVTNIKDLQNFYRQEWISSQFAYELRMLHDQYSRMGRRKLQCADSALLQLLKQEVERLVWKKKPAHISDACIAKVVKHLHHMMDGKGDALRQLNLLAEQLIIAINLEKEGNFRHEIIENSTA